MSFVGLKWFFAISGATLDYEEYDWRAMIRVAVISALRHTSLRPHMIYDGADDAFAAEMRGLGVVVLQCRSPLYEALRGRALGNQRWLDAVAGAFLRFEIPRLEQQEEYVLYTDCDVMFLKEPYFGLLLPRVFGATSQFSENPAEDMNSGVMLLNVPNFRTEMPALMDFTYRSLDLGLDQEMLRAFFGSDYLVLDRTLNWKPYWGYNPAAQIVHFHGPKPVSARAFLMEGKPAHDPNWQVLLERDRESYYCYVRLWYYYETLAIEALRSVSG